MAGHREEELEIHLLCDLSKDQRRRLETLAVEWPSGRQAGALEVKFELTGRVAPVQVE